ncbi:glutathione S-transferase [Geopyxis carbonaria]|nr:glutathione S-transferase [Geopyxis carbonaria]
MASVYNYLFGGKTTAASVDAENKKKHDGHHRHDPKKTCIELFTAHTPNGQKASITLEVLGLKYKPIKLDLEKGEQKQDWFLKINPNGRIPAIVDKSHMHTKHDMSVFESGSIQMYLVEHFDPDHCISFHEGCPQYWEMLEWLFFMNSGIGPMQGQVNYFKKAPEHMPFAIHRFEEETKRLYGVLDTRLMHMKKTMPRDVLEAQKNNGHRHGHHGHHGMFLVGHKFSIADIANFTWVNIAEDSGIDMTGMDHLMEWRECIRGMECVKRGLGCPGM